MEKETRTAVNRHDEHAKITSELFGDVNLLCCSLQRMKSVKLIEPFMLRNFRDSINWDGCCAIARARRIS